MDVIKCILRYFKEILAIPTSNKYFPTLEPAIKLKQGGKAMYLNINFNSVNNFYYRMLVKAIRNVLMPYSRGDISILRMLLICFIVIDIGERRSIILKP